MKRLSFTSLFLSTLLAFSYAKIVIVFDEKIEICAKEDERAGKFDLSELEIVATDDTHSFMNDTWKFTGDITAPWFYHMYCERYERGQWNVFAFNKRVPNFCAAVHRPPEPWYNIFKKVHGCPIKNGVSFLLFASTRLIFYFSLYVILKDEWKFDMVPLEFPIIFPKNYKGRWRLVQSTNLKSMVF